MGLVSGGANVYQPEPWFVEFGMKDGDKTVIVRVSDNALGELEPDHMKRGMDHVAACDVHRERLEKIAARKYVDGQLERDGTILIRTSDLRRVI
jgi:hypothetical protein